jgi:hypothetical protein
MLCLTLPLPQELISLVSDAIIMNGWVDQQSMHKQVIVELKKEIGLYEHNLYWGFPGHERLDSYFISNKRYWRYISSDRKADGTVLARPTIDDVLKSQNSK